jgi:hypothetical protein
MPKRRVKLLSKNERDRRAQQREASLATVQPLIHPRRAASRLLSCSVAKLIRLEKAGRLTPIKLDPESKSSQTYYTDEQLRALASGGDR